MSSIPSDALIACCTRRQTATRNRKHTENYNTSAHVILFTDEGFIDRGLARYSYARHTGSSPIHVSLRTCLRLPSSLRKRNQISSMMQMMNCILKTNAIRINRDDIRITSIQLHMKPEKECECENAILENADNLEKMKKTK
jgi:hypothetical protein